MRHRHHQQPLAGPGRGTEVPGVGADSRRPIRRVRRAARRPESRSPARARPRRSDRRNVPSIMRCLDPLFYPWPTADSPGGLGRGVARPVGDGVRQAGALSLPKSRVSLTSGPAQISCGPAMPDHFVSRHPIGAETERARSRDNDRLSLVRLGRHPRSRDGRGRLSNRVGRTESAALLLIGPG